jgi:hypothetical protein
MARPFRYQKHEVMDALAACRGLASLAARRLGCTHETVLNYMKRYPEVKVVAQRYRHMMTDIAELKYWAVLQEGTVWAIAMQLKTQGRDRSYGDAVDFNFVLNQVLKQLAEEVVGQFQIEKVNIRADPRFLESSRRAD